MVRPEERCFCIFLTRAQKHRLLALVISLSRVTVNNSFVLLLFYMQILKWSMRRAQA
jgi:hypothetical protein